MEGTWSTELADELTRCLVDADACAGACEAVLESVRASGDRELQGIAAGALVVPAAIAGVLAELGEESPPIVLAACRLCRESALRAASDLEPLGDDSRVSSALSALHAVAESCETLLVAAS